MTKTSRVDETSLHSPKELIQLAGEAARANRPDKMLLYLNASGFLDGLVRRLQMKWPKLPRFEIEECIAKAVDKAYDASTQGRIINHLGAWLWKAADNSANDCWRYQYLYRSAISEGIENIPSSEFSAPMREEPVDQEELAENMRKEAIQIARRLLPRIGQGQVVSVMELIIEAVEQRVPDLSSVEVGNTLGISSSAARTLTKRGLERLQREAVREGIMFQVDLSLDEEPEN